MANQECVVGETKRHASKQNHVFESDYIYLDIVYNHVSNLLHLEAEYLFTLFYVCQSYGRTWGLWAVHHVHITCMCELDVANFRHTHTH